MAKRKLLADPDRVTIGEIIDAEVESARESINRANVLARLLNALDPSGDQIEIDGNVVVGVFKKEAE